MPKSKTRKKAKKSRHHARTYLLFVFYTLLLLFYPGDSYYVELFFYNRDLFAHARPSEQRVASPVPYVKDPLIAPDISAEGLYVVELRSFTPVSSRGTHDRFSPASTAKIITALVAFDTYDLYEALEVVRIVEEGQIMKLEVGEKISVENLLYGVLVHSANDAAYVLADNYPGGYAKFVAAMNKKASDLKLTNSHFVNPAGLDEEEQYVTPFDLALAGRALLENPTLAQMASIKSITVSDADFARFHELRNVNKLLGEIEGIGGLKTGYTLDAGENLITFYKKNGAKFLVVLLKSEDRFEDTKRVVEWIDGNVGFIEL